MGDLDTEMKKHQHRKLTLEKNILPAATAEDRTRDLSVTSPAPYHRATYPSEHARDDWGAGWGREGGGRGAG